MAFQVECFTSSAHFILIEPSKYALALLYPWLKASNGTPQGSVLSPMLFSLMINNLPKRITSHAALYVDDFCFWEGGSDITFLNQLCQRSLTKVRKWCEDWFQTVWHQICCCPAYKETQSSTYVLASAERYPHSTKKWVQGGLTFQRNGSYSTHIQKVVAKCGARLSVIRMLKGRSWVAGKRPLLNVYRSLVRSVTEYGMEASFSRLPVY